MPKQSMLDRHLSETITLPGMPDTLIRRIDCYRALLAGGHSARTADFVAFTARHVPGEPHPAAFEICRDIGLGTFRSTLDYEVA